MKSFKHLFYIWITYLCSIDSAFTLKKYYLEDQCDLTLNMTDLQISAGRLFDSRRNKYRNRFSCHVTIQAPVDRQIVIVFRELAIEWESNCDDDYITLYDGQNTDTPLVKDTYTRMCGHQLPASSYTTTGSALTVYFHSDLHKQDNGFELIFTAFHKSSPCLPHELQCTNGRCIDDSLQCNNFDNCGDGSDECQINAEVMMGIVLSVFLLTVFGVGVITIYRKQSRLRTTKLKDKHAKQQPDICQSIKLTPYCSDANIRSDATNFGYRSEDTKFGYRSEDTSFGYRSEDTNFGYKSEDNNSQQQPPARRKWKQKQKEQMAIWSTLPEEIPTEATGHQQTLDIISTTLEHKRASF